MSGTVDELDRFDPDRATSYDVILAGLHPVAARVEQPTDQSRRPARACTRSPRGRSSDVVPPSSIGLATTVTMCSGAAAIELHERVGSAERDEAPARRRAGLGPVARRRGAPVRRTPGALAGLAVRGGERTVSAGWSDMAAEVQLSPRQLRALTVAELGLSPKELCRLLRFDRVVAQLIQEGGAWPKSPPLPGYADQSHLTREFRQMAGCSPTAWLAEERRNIQDGGHRNRPD